MWRLTWRLVTTGIPFSFQPTVAETELNERIQKQSVWRALRRTGTEPQVAFTLKEQKLTAYVVKLSIWVLARPVFYADIQSDDQPLTITGRFFLQKLTRVEFWLVFSAAVVYEGIWLNRCINRILDGIPIDQLIGFLLMLLPGIVVVVLTMSILSYFLRKNVADIQILTDALKKIAT